MACPHWSVTVEKAQGFGEFLGGLRVAGASGAVLFWGTVSENRANIAEMRADLTQVQGDLRSVSSDTAYTRGQISAISSRLLTPESPE
jgi:alanine dehydrogenase